MIWLIAGLLVFFSVHSISIAASSWRDQMVARLGEGPWKGLYSLLSFLGLYLIVQGYGMARIDPVVLYSPPVWMRHITLLLMLFVFPLVLAAYFPGRIKATLKHPMLVAVKTWAFAHLLANGTLADVLLFGAFLAWAVVDRISLKRRTPRNVPGAPPGKFNDLIAVVAGLTIYVVLLVWGHAWLFGVSPLG